MEGYADPLPSKDHAQTVVQMRETATREGRFQIARVPPVIHLAPLLAIGVVQGLERSAGERRAVVVEEREELDAAVRKLVGVFNTAH